MAVESMAAVADAERILVPTGRDYDPCVQAFQATFDIEVPEFPGRQLVVQSGGRAFAKVKGKQVPQLVAAGKADVGLTGTDVCEEWIDADNANVSFGSIGPPMCSFEVLAPSERLRSVMSQLYGDGEPVVATTSLPRLLGKAAAAMQLRLVAAQDVLAGSVEVAPAMGWSQVVADVWQTGETARANGLTNVLKLTDIEPAVVWHVPGKNYTPALSAEGIRRIDDTLSQRDAQVDNPGASSYTLELLRDPNEAGKKFGQEFSEAMMAVFGPGTIEDCEGELADLLYAGIVVARGQGKPVRFEHVLRILIARNQARPSARSATSRGGFSPRH